MLHTKGPWYAVAYANFWLIQSSPYYEDKGDLLNEESNPDAAANAVLMSAAPDLLEALTKLYMSQYAGNSRSLKEAMDRATGKDEFEMMIIKAIKKASLYDN